MGTGCFSKVADKCELTSFKAVGGSKVCWYILKKMITHIRLCADWMGKTGELQSGHGFLSIQTQRV